MHKCMILIAVVLSIVSGPSAARSKLDRLISADMLGVQRAYFEKKAGIAKRVSGKERQYDVGGCLINIVEDSNQSIVSIELENISKNCSFDSASVFLNGPVHKITFSSLQAVNVGGGAKEACLGFCGNSADPTYGLLVETPRSMTGIEFDADVAYNKSSSAAADRLQKILEKCLPGIDLFGDYLGTKIPEKIYSELWINEFSRVRITSIRFGYNILRK